VLHRVLCEALNRRSFLFLACIHISITKPMQLTPCNNKVYYQLCCMRAHNREPVSRRVEAPLVKGVADVAIS